MSDWFAVIPIALLVAFVLWGWFAMDPRRRNR